MRRRNKKSDQLKHQSSKQPRVSSIATDTAGDLIKQAVASQRQSCLSTTENAYRRALEACPASTDICYQLAIVLLQKGDTDAAEEMISRTIKLNPEHAPAQLLLGNLRVVQNRTDHAIEAFSRAVDIDSNLPQAHHNLGNALVIAGRTREAIETFKRVLAIAPDHADAHRQLAQLVKHTEKDCAIEAMQALYKHPSASNHQRMLLAFGLGKAYEDIGEYDKSFDFISEANRLKRAEFDYSIDDEKTFFQSIRDTFTPSLFASHASSGTPDQRPIFILGMPRSGSSLVEQILSSHPQVYGAGELDCLDRTARLLRNPLQGYDYPTSASDLENKDLLAGAKSYLSCLENHCSGKRFCTDKMPQNFFHIGMIRLMLPSARIIHCIRDPMDNCLSIFKNYFSGSHVYSYNMEELAKYYILYRELMTYWHEVLPGFVFDIQYEALIMDQKTETRKLLEHCGLGWDDACMEFHKTRRSIATASATQVRQPIYKTSVQLWKRYEKHLYSLRRLLESL